MRQQAWLNLKYVTGDTLQACHVDTINLYNKFELPGYWGSGKSASADGTKWSVYEQNLLSEYHIRYGGYGGIGYYHVSDKYIALFSRFIPCGAYEAIYILDGLIENRSDIRPDTVHGDTQAQIFPCLAWPICWASSSCLAFATSRTSRCPSRTRKCLTRIPRRSSAAEASTGT
ncbi:hypothetical protein RLIN73S_02262 [Rhodanobacter lindaniclasticus]